MVKEKCQDVPCKPVLDSLDKKMSSKIAMWVISGIAAFVVVVIGGAQWILVEKTAKIQSVQEAQKDLQVDQNRRLNRIEKHIWE
jgi:hypothetical protein